LFSLVLVLVQTSNTSNSTFEHRKATTHRVSDSLAGVEGAGSTFFGNANLNNEPDLDDMSVVRLPTAIPLPFGHGIECTSASDCQAMLSLGSKLDDIDERLVTWVYAMHFSINHFDGILVNHGSLNINRAFFKPLPVIPELQPQIDVSLSPLVPNLPLVMQIHARLSTVQESILDAWILANKTFCDPIIDRYSATLGSQPQQCGTNQTPMQISV
jgi:hypothetical protein